MARDRKVLELISEKLALRAAEARRMQSLREGQGEHRYAAVHKSFAEMYEREKREYDRLLIEGG